MPSSFSSFEAAERLRVSANRRKIRHTTSAWKGSISRWPVAGLYV
jgi:hypothetical protein